MVLWTHSECLVQLDKRLPHQQITFDCPSWSLFPQITEPVAFIVAQTGNHPSKQFELFNQLAVFSAVLVPHKPLRDRAHERIEPNARPANWARAENVIGAIQTVRKEVALLKDELAVALVTPILSVKLLPWRLRENFH